MNEDELRGKFLTKLRLEKNLTQSDLAKMLGYSDKSISKWERGKCFPKDTKTLIKLAEILDVSIDDLLHLEYSDVEGKNTPHLKNKYLNFIFQNRKIFIIIFIVIILLFLGYLILVVDFKSSNNILLNGGSEVENINKNSLDNLEYENEIGYNDELYSADRNRSNIKSNHTKLLDEGFIFNDNLYYKNINYNTVFYFLNENYSFKIYFNSFNGELFIITNSIYYNEIVVEKYCDEKHEIEYIKIDEIKDCNLEKCETYLDYAMYINYMKKLIL